MHAVRRQRGVKLTVACRVARSEHAGTLIALAPFTVTVTTSQSFESSVVFFSLLLGVSLTPAPRSIRAAAVSRPLYMNDIVREYVLRFV